VATKGTDYECSECGRRTPQWSGRCPDCGEWNSLEEVVPEEDEPRTTREPDDVEACTLQQVSWDRRPRMSTGTGEFDRVLGGGLLRGSTILLGGEPGVGKSTIVLQSLGQMAGERKCLYMACEESLPQVKLRARRLDVEDSSLVVSGETDLEAICHLLEREDPDVVVVDSVQMVSAEGIDSLPGSLKQLRTCGGELIRRAKKRGTALILVGHATKQGAIAGPRALEHLVDAVLYFESENFQALRVLRAVKNRFGPANEVGVFEMASGGLEEVLNPSEFFLSEREAASAGSAVTSTVEGSRALLLETQALVVPGAYGTPERRVTGADRRRVSMLLAVLQRRAGLDLLDCDVFVNVAGGVSVQEPGADLALALAIASGFQDRPFAPEMVAVGEVGLGGEVRGVGRMEERMKEAQRLGFERVMMPAGVRVDGDDMDLDLTRVKTLDQALAAAVGS